MQHYPTEKRAQLNENLQGAHSTLTMETSSVSEICCGCQRRAKEDKVITLKSGHILPVLCTKNQDELGR